MRTEYREILAALQDILLRLLAAVTQGKLACSALLRPDTIRYDTLCQLERDLCCNSDSRKRGS